MGMTKIESRIQAESSVIIAVISECRDEWSPDLRDFIVTPYINTKFSACTLQIHA